MAVQQFQSRTQLQGNFPYLPRGEGPVGIKILLQAAAFCVFFYDIGAAAVFRAVKNLRQARMAQRSQFL